MYTSNKRPAASMAAYGLALLAAVFAPPLPAAQAVDSNQDNPASLYGKDGRLVKVNGREMYIRCVGSAPGPLVVMDSGMGGFAPEWFAIQDMLPDMRSCSYDRAGYGHSSPTTEPRISSLLAEELHDLLQGANQDGPYILVGHSFGGYNIRYFAGAWPKEVVGMVLVDSAHPEQFALMPSLPEQGNRNRHQFALNSRVRLRPVVVTRFSGDETIGLYPPELRSAIRSLMLSRKSVYTERQEFLGFKHSATELDWVRFPDSLPLAVVHRGRRVWEDTPIGNSRELMWRQLQEDLSTLSKESVVLEARDSGHMVHMEQPEKVVQAIRWAFRRSCLNAGMADIGCSPVQVWEQNNN